jgi:glutathione S-transferase
MYQLYYYPGNANLAPHMVLEEIGVGHELILVDRNQNAQKSADYLKLNPNGRLPTLIDGDLVLYEAAAICLHLADRHPEAGLVPELASDERAQCYKWLMYLTNTIQAELLYYFYPQRLSADEAAAAQVKTHAEQRAVSSAGTASAKAFESLLTASMNRLLPSRWRKMCSIASRMTETRCAGAPVKKSL